MGWAKVNSKHKKPLGWWYNKIMCEIAWNFIDHSKTYYKYLNRLCDYGFNLYGDKI